MQESLLAVPYAYAQLAANGQAAEQYRHAVSAFAAETARLDESIAAIRGGGFLDAVLAAATAPEAKPDDADRAGWLWQLKQAPDAPHTRYLYQLLASHAFQEGLRNYRDLRHHAAQPRALGGLARGLPRDGGRARVGDRAARTAQGRGARGHRPRQRSRRAAPGSRPGWPGWSRPAT